MGILSEDFILQSGATTSSKYYKCVLFFYLHGRHSNTKNPLALDHFPPIFAVVTYTIEGFNQFLLPFKDCTEYLIGNWTCLKSIFCSVH